ncbi:hypothetical protein D9M72_426390 [compost metagenome]
MGSVIRMNRCQALAPSTSAASRMSPGTACSPARKMIMSVPRFRQTASRIRAGMDHVVLFSQSGPAMPTQPRMTFSSPSGWRMNRHTTATATMLVTTGV